MWRTLLLFGLWLCLCAHALGLPEQIYVGGLFDSDDKDLELAFRYVIDHINADDSILPRSRLSAKIRRLPPHDSFHAAKVVCDIFGEGVVAILGPTSPDSDTVVDSACEALQVPHLETHWTFRPLRNSNRINLHPDAETLSQAFLSLVNFYQWKTFTFIYENSEDLIRMKDFFTSTSLTSTKVTLKQYNEGDSYKKLLKDLQRAGETNIVLSIPYEKIKHVFQEAAKVNMLTEYHNYLITNLDMSTLALDDFQELHSNISGFRLVNPNTKEVKGIVRDRIFEELRYGRRSKGRDQLKTQEALIYDAVTLLAQTLDSLDRSQPLTIRPVSCLNQQPWLNGISIINYMKVVNNVKGLTGVIKFDEKGKRTSFMLELIALRKSGMQIMGNWSLEAGIIIDDNFKSKDELEKMKSLKGRLLRVVSMNNPPYTIRKPDFMNRSGNDRYEGYTVDLIDLIAKYLEFKYEFDVLPDGKYQNMLDKVIARAADLAIVDLTITSEREETVDFTKPFMSLGISILFKKETQQETSVFSFLEPLSLEVWFYMATVYLGVSLLMFFLARFTPYEWVNPHPCDLETQELENQFNLPNSLWFTIGSLMQQGSDLAPRAVSIRLLASMWWFFTLIMISTYTANLAAFLTASRLNSPIENANDLAKQTTIKYGCVKSGATRNFFKKSTTEPFKRMATYMESAKPSVFVNTNKEGIDRARKGNYAFLMESTTIDYQIARHCDLTKIGDNLDRKGYGIATPQNSPYTTTLSNVLTMLEENGTLYLLKERWWKPEGHICPITSAASSTSELGLGNVGGVFVVLAGGVTMAVVIVLLEFIWRTKKVPRDFRDSVCMELMKEIKMVLTFRGSTRPIPKSESASMNESLKLVPLKNASASSTKS